MSYSDFVRRLVDRLQDRREQKSKFAFSILIPRNDIKPANQIASFEKDLDIFISNMHLTDNTLSNFGTNYTFKISGIDTL